MFYRATIYTLANFEQKIIVLYDYHIVV